MDNCYIKLHCGPIAELTVFHFHWPAICYESVHQNLLEHWGPSSRQIYSYNRKISLNASLWSSTEFTVKPILKPVIKRLRCNMSQRVRFWSLSHRRLAKAQASLRIRTVTPEPLLFAHMKYGSRQRVQPKIRHLAPLDDCAWEFEE